jgi:hypothetical protein
VHQIGASLSSIKTDSHTSRDVQKQDLTRCDSIPYDPAGASLYSRWKRAGMLPISTPHDQGTDLNVGRLVVDRYPTENRIVSCPSKSDCRTLIFPNKHVAIRGCISGRCPSFNRKAPAKKQTILRRSRDFLYSRRHSRRQLTTREDGILGVCPSTESRSTEKIHKLSPRRRIQEVNTSRVVIWDKGQSFEPYMSAYEYRS